MAIASWGIALFEDLLQVPANRIGFAELSLPRLKILQEVITLSVFVPFAILYMRQPLELDSLWAALCLLGAASFIFRAYPRYSQRDNSVTFPISSAGAANSFPSFGVRTT